MIPLASCRRLKDGIGGVIEGETGEVWLNISVHRGFMLGERGGEASREGVEEGAEYQREGETHSRERIRGETNTGAGGDEEIQRGAGKRMRQGRGMAQEGKVEWGGEWEVRRGHKHGLVVKGKETSKKESHTTYTRRRGRRRQHPEKTTKDSGTRQLHRE